MPGITREELDSLPECLKLCHATNRPITDYEKKILDGLLQEMETDNFHVYTMASREYKRMLWLINGPNVDPVLKGLEEIKVSLDEIKHRLAALEAAR